MGSCIGKDELGDSIPRNAAIDCSNVTEPNKPIICLIGGPGAGKTTLGKRLAAKYGFMPITVSELMRAEANSGTERGSIIKKMMQDGRNLPADVVIQKIEEKIVSAPSLPGYLIIGFPRNKKQIKLFVKEVRQPNLCIYLWARKQVLEERMRSRAVAKERFDDAEMTIVERIKTFFNSVGGVVGTWKKITTNIDAEKSEDEVFRLGCATIDALMTKLKTSSS